MKEFKRHLELGDLIALDYLLEAYGSTPELESLYYRATRHEGFNEGGEPYEQFRSNLIQAAKRLIK